MACGMVKTDCSADALSVYWKRGGPIFSATSPLAKIWRLRGCGDGLTPDVKYFICTVGLVFWIIYRQILRDVFPFSPFLLNLLSFFMFQSASQGPPPSFFFLLRLSPSFSIPCLHISALLLLLLSLCRPCGAARPWWTLPAQRTRSSRYRISNRWTSTTLTGLRSVPASGGCCRNRTVLQVLQFTDAEGLLGWGA